MKFFAFAVVVQVGTVPPGNLNIVSKVSARPPVASWSIAKLSTMPSVRFVGLASLHAPVIVSLKLFDLLASMATVVPDVSANGVTDYVADHTPSADRR
jgi:hypothetical protein